MRYGRKKLATRNGLEPSTSSVTGWRANRLHHRAKYGGNNRARTYDLLLVRQMLSQLSYAPDVRRRESVISDMTHYTQEGVFCQAKSSIFLKKLFQEESRGFPLLSTKNQIFLSSS